MKAEQDLKHTYKSVLSNKFSERVYSASPPWCLFCLLRIMADFRDGVNGYLLNYLSKPPLCILNPYRHSDGLVRSFSCQGLLEPNAIGNMGSRDVRDEWVEEVSSTALRGVRARCMCHVLLCVKINCAWRAWPERAGSVAYFHCAGVK